MIASVVAAAFGFLSAATFTRLLSPGDYGIYVVGVGISGYVSSLLFTWVRFSVMRLQSEGVQRDLRLTALAGYGVSAATAPFVFLVITHVSQREWQEIACATVLALGIGLFELGQEIMRARFQVREFVTGAALRAVLSFGFCIAAIELGMGGIGLLAGAALAYYVTGAISARSVWRAPRARADLNELALFIRLGFVFTLTGFIYTFQGSLDRLFLAWHSSEAFSGLYGASADLTRQIIQMPAGSIAAAAFPLAVNSLAQSGASEAREQLKRFGEVLLAVSVPSAIGLALTIPYLASFLLGPAFRDTAASIVPILAGGWLFQCITQYYVHVSFHLAKRPELSLLQGLTGVLVNVACIWPLTDRWGMAGTASSFLISEACGVAVGVALTRFSYPLPDLLGPLLRTLLACGVMAGVVLALERLLPVPGALAFGVLAVSGMLAYALAAVALNICEARTMLRVLAVRFVSAPERNVGRSV
jgi:O-antigen/teichoic acid export membrane protein